MHIYTQLFLICFLLPAHTTFCSANNETQSITPITSLAKLGQRGMYKKGSQKELSLLLKQQNKLFNKCFSEKNRQESAHILTQDFAQIYDKWRKLQQINFARILNISKDNKLKLSNVVNQFYKVNEKLGANFIFFLTHFREDEITSRYTQHLIRCLKNSKACTTLSIDMQKNITALPEHKAYTCYLGEKVVAETELNISLWEAISTYLSIKDMPIAKEAQSPLRPFCDLVAYLIKQIQSPQAALAFTNSIESTIKSYNESAKPLATLLAELNKPKKKSNNSFMNRHIQLQQSSHKNKPKKTTRRQKRPQKAATSKNNKPKQQASHSAKDEQKKLPFTTIEDTENNATILLFPTTEAIGKKVTLNYTHNVKAWFENPNKALENQEYTNIESKKFKYRITAKIVHAFSKEVDKYMPTNANYGEIFNRKNNRNDILLTIAGSVTQDNIEKLGVFSYIIDSKTHECYHRNFVPTTGFELLTMHLGGGTETIVKKIYDIEFPAS